MNQREKPQVVTSASSSSERIVSHKEVDVSLRSSQDDEIDAMALKQLDRKALRDGETKTIRAIRQGGEELEEKRRERWLELPATYEKMRHMPYSIDQNFLPVYDQFRHLQSHEERRAALQQADKEWYAAHPDIWWKSITDSYGAVIPGILRLMKETS